MANPRASLPTRSKTLGSLHSAIGSGIDRLAASAEAGADSADDVDIALPGEEDDGTDADADDGSDEGADGAGTTGDEGGEGEGQGADAAAAPEGGEGTEGEESPSRDGAEAATGDKTEGDESGEPTEADKALELLNSYPKSKQDAIKKFLPGGVPDTVSDVAMAERLAYEDYWRNHKRLADLAKQPPAAPESADKKTEKDQPAEVPVELQPYDRKIQTIVEQGKYAVKNIEGWQQEEVRLQAHLDDLHRRLTRGDPAVEKDEIIQVHEQILAAQRNKAEWESVFKRRAAEEIDVLGQRKLVSDMLETRARLDRQEQSAAARDRDNETGQFTAAFDREVKRLAKLNKIPQEKFDRFRRLLGQAVYVEGQQRLASKRDPFTVADLPTFMTPLAAEFQGDIATAKAEGAKAYSTAKRGDAPKAPKQKQRMAPARQKSNERSRDLRSLRASIENSEAWDKV